MIISKQGGLFTNIVVLAV